ncbi:hypothetical protein [Marinifilum sp.]|uniref:hypothetical protein n=1 Tax=Marinifilum sp. TaxID=2033137 RepID=UPI003BAADFA3
MKSNQILRRDNTLTEEVKAIKTTNFNGIEFSYEEVYYLDYDVDENTGMINKEKLAKFYKSSQVQQNTKAMKSAYEVAKRKA